MRAFRILSLVAVTAGLLGGCPEAGPTQQGGIDEFEGGLPADLGLGDGNDPFSIDDLLTDLGTDFGDTSGPGSEPNLPDNNETDLGDPDASADPGGDDDPADAGTSTDDAPPVDPPAEDDAPDDTGDDDAGETPDESSDGDDPGDDDGDDAGDDPNDADPNSPDPNDPDDPNTDDPNDADPNDAVPPPATLNGSYGGTITCQTWQALVDSDPNTFDLPEEPSVGSAEVALEFASVGQPDGIWIPAFIDGPDGFAEVTEVGQLVVLDDTYNAMTVTIRVEVLEVDNDGTTARTAADVTMRFRDEFGTVLIRADGVVTQEVTARQDGTATYRNDVWYDAKLWTPDHAIQFDAVEVHDCDGVLE